MSDKDKLIWFAGFYTESEFSKPLENDRFFDLLFNDKELIKETDNIKIENILHQKVIAIKSFGVMNDTKKYYYETKTGMFKINEKEYKLHFVYNSKDFNITNYEYARYSGVVFNRLLQIVDGTKSKEKGCIFGYSTKLKYKEFDWKSIKMDVLYLVDDTEYFQINITSSFDIRHIKLVLEDNQNNTYTKIITLEQDKPNQFIFELK